MKRIPAVVVRLNNDIRQLIGERLFVEQLPYMLFQFEWWGVHNPVVALYKHHGPMLFDSLEDFNAYEKLALDIVDLNEFWVESEFGYVDDCRKVVVDPAVVVRLAESADNWHEVSDVWKNFHASLKAALDSP